MVDSTEKAELPATTPITLLSGFLGAGKTTLLKHLLENKAGLKVGLLVNDVAEINIDAVLVSKKTGGASAAEDTVELQNGCACCTAAEEFLQGIEQLMKLSRERGTPWDHIVIESSGVAEPREVRDNFRNALVSQPELLEGTKLHTMVTVVDGSTFLEEFQKRNKLQDRPDLGTGDFVDSTRQVVDLMCEQIECADILILNKADLVESADEMQLLREAVKSLNSAAQVHTSERGRVDLAQVLAAATGGGVAEMDEDMEHRRMVEMVKAEATAHGHAEHSHAAPKADSSAAPPGAAEANGHAEVHAHGHADAKAECEPNCTDAQHEHGGGEAAATGETSQAHGHGHVHESRESKRFGITSFCYQRRRPFHPHRLMSVIRQLDVKDTPAQAEATYLPALKGALMGAAAVPTPAEAPAGKSPMHSLIRSKGFIWLSNSHMQIFYWALAGRHFELKQYATWWGAVPREEWPTDEKEVAEILKDFADDEMGDRRQELVFIGVNMDREAITLLLDGCLLTETELLAYNQHWNQESAAANSAA